MKLKILITLLLSWLLSWTWLAPAKSLELPPPFEAVYRLHKGPLTLGEVKVTLGYEGDRYHYKKITTSQGVIALFRNDEILEQSQGAIADNKLHFEKYSYRQSRGKKLRESQIEIKGDLATGHYKGKPFTLNIPPGTLDRTSMEIAMMRDAVSDQNLLSYKLVIKNRLKNYRFLFTGRESINITAGDFDCKRYKRMHESKKRATTLCLAPRLDYLPVHATHAEKGNSFDMELVRYRSGSSNIVIK